MEVFIDSLTLAKGVVLLSFRGEAGAENSDLFRTRLAELLADIKERYIFSFKELNYMNTSSLGILIHFIKKIVKSGGKVKMAELSPAVYELFDMTRVSKVFEAYRTREDALDAF